MQIAAKQERGLSLCLLKRRELPRLVLLVLFFSSFCSLFYFPAVEHSGDCAGRADEIFL